MEAVPNKLNSVATLGICSFLLFSSTATASIQSTDAYQHYSQVRLNAEQMQVVKETQKWVRAHCIRHGEKNRETIEWISKYVLNIFWRESNFKNISNHNDHDYFGKRQSVFGYGQFREDSYRELLKSYEQGHKKSFPRPLANVCSNEWKAGQYALRCQVEVLTYAVRRSLAGNSRHIKRWGTQLRALADTQREWSSRKVSRTLASSR